MGAVDDFIAEVKALMETHPKAAAIQQRYNIPEYDEARHYTIMEKLQGYDILNPRPEQALQLHLHDRANEKKPRKRKK